MSYLGLKPRAIDATGVTDGYVLQAVGGKTVYAANAGGGGGGSTGSYPPGSADKPPTTRNVKDDEFDGTTTVTWTPTPTAPNAIDANVSRASHLYVKSSGTGANFVGQVQPVPAAYPFTLTSKLITTARSNFHRGGGIILGPAAPVAASALMFYGIARDSGLGGVVTERIKATFGGTFSSASSAVLTGWPGPVYVKVRVNSATSVDAWASTDGYAWVLIESAFNPGFTPGVMGIASAEDSVGGGVEAWSDFFRVT